MSPSHVWIRLKKQNKINYKLQLFKERQISVHGSGAVDVSQLFQNAINLISSFLTLLRPPNTKAKERKRTSKRKKNRLI